MPSDNKLLSESAFLAVRFVVGVDSRHVGIVAAPAAADQSERDPLVRPHDPRVTGGRECQGGAGRGRRQELSAGRSALHGSFSA